MARHDAAQPGYRETAFPTKRALAAESLDDRINQHRQILGDIAGHFGEAVSEDTEDDDPVGLVDLRSSDAGAPRVVHGFDHILDEAAHPRCRWVADGRCSSAQNRVPHAGDFQQCHEVQYVLRPAPGKARPPPLPQPASHLAASMLNIAAGRCQVGPARCVSMLWRRGPVQVVVRDNNVDQALRALKKKMQREGVFREMKLRRNYEKPSERRAREKAEAVRRYRKLLRKRLEREGY